MTQPIIKTHHAQSDTNLELLNFVNQRSSATWLELYTAFSEDGSGISRWRSKRFDKKLEYLMYTGRLICSGRGKARVFYIGPDAGQATPGRGRVDIRAGQTSGSDVMPADDTPPPIHLKYRGALATPRDFSTLLSADTYVPPPQTALRPGSLDFKRYASHGDQC